MNQLQTIPGLPLTLPENEPRGSNSSKPSTSLSLSGTVAPAARVGGEAEVGNGAAAFAWLGLATIEGEDALGAEAIEFSQSLQLMKS